MIQIYDGYDSYVQGGHFSSPRKNLGNKLFIYACCRIIADILDYDLISPNRALVRRETIKKGGYQNQIFPFKSVLGRKRVESPLRVITDNDIVNAGSLETLINQSPNHGYLNQSYFSKYDYIKPYKDNVRELYSPIIKNKRKKNDMVIMLRNSRLDGSFLLPDDYYMEIIKNESFDNLYISLDHYDKHQSLLGKLEKYNPKIIEKPILDLFKEITSFNKIISAQGTFSFWAAFLSNASKIYWPITNDGPNSGKNSNNAVYNTYVNLLVDDESRYEYINVENIYKI